MKKLYEYKNENENLQSDNMRLQLDCNNLKQHVNALENLKQRSVGELKTEVDKSKKLELQNHELTKLLDNSKSETQGMKETNGVLEERMDMLESDLVVSSEISDELESENIQLGDECISLKSQLKEIKKTNGILEEQRVKEFDELVSKACLSLKSQLEEMTDDRYVVHFNSCLTVFLF
jgi:hypothetical protein